MSLKAELISNLSSDNREVILRLDKVLGIPENLARLDGVYKGLSTAASALPEAHYPVRNDINTFCELSKAFLERKPQDKNPRLYEPLENISDPFRGILGKNPFYPIFFFEQENEELRPAYRRLIELVLSSRLAGMGQGFLANILKPNRHEKLALSSSCRVIRDLHKDNADAKHVLEAIDDLGNPAQICNWIREGFPELTSGLPSAAVQKLRYLGQFLASCHGLDAVMGKKGFATRVGGYGGGHDSVDLALWDRRKHLSNSAKIEDAEKQDTGLELRRITSHPSSIVRKEYEGSGLIVSELYPDTEYWVGFIHDDEPEEFETDSNVVEVEVKIRSGSSVTQLEIETGIPSYRKYFTASKRRAERFNFENQKLPSRWSRFTLNEKAQFLTFLNRTYSNAVKIIKNGTVTPSQIIAADRKKDLCLTIGIMVALGRGHNSVRELHVIDREDQWQKNTMGIVFIKETQQWLVSTVRLGYRSKPENKEIRWYRPVTPRILLADLFGLGQAVCELSCSLKTKQPLRKRKVESQQKLLNDLVNSYKRDLDCRFQFTMETAESILADWMEVNVSPTITGLLIPKKAATVSTQLFYSCVKADRLESSYYQAWHELSKLLTAEGAELIQESGSILFSYRPPVSDLKLNIGIYIGSERTVKLEKVSGLVSSLKKYLRETSGENLVELHNRYSAYTWLYLAYSTASRGVHHPFEYLQYAVEIGSLNLHDKDFEGQGQARVAFLNEDLIQHLKYYLGWSLRILEVIVRGRTYTGIAPSLMAVSSKRKTLSMQGKRVDYPLFGSLFFLTEDFEALPATPSTLKYILGDTYPVPANAQRKLLRSELLERSCSERTIDAFLGHWDRGQEPWAKYSTLDPQVFRSELFDSLAPILAELGFGPVEIR